MKSFSERFWEKVNVLGPDECWTWKISNGKHRPSFWTGTKTIKAAKVALQLSGIAVPKYLNVLHKCNNILCVNPAHLFVGTQSENMKQANKEGRIFTGSRFKNGNTANLLAKSTGNQYIRYHK